MSWRFLISQDTLPHWGRSLISQDTLPHWGRSLVSQDTLPHWGRCFDYRGHTATLGETFDDRGCLPHSVLLVKESGTLGIKRKDVRDRGSKQV
ncbi:hypothetical protein K504DRAFT_46944 [Pleomassaria siparia CBS 279.74]|uniref:Uncharacterized protein n=1 Tax=Pleomassaria siparia CBS 279.74 TaxID=1314801 RepID=A0A6G1K4Y0_9PLEO|nr:hypothetical protein K504DRAFT_46944 [Pleomassaria siparia CBS 279.74]